MVFSSSLFVFLFFPITFILYYTANKTGKIIYINTILLFASVLFYMWGGIKYFLILFAVILMNYLLSIIMVKYESYKKIIFILILAIDLGNLFYFKYFNFFIDNIQNAGNYIGINVFSEVAVVALPIGISFYTFQIISYVADVYIGKVKVQRNFLNLSLYVIMFPQLIAGPIVRYKDVAEEINSRTIQMNDIEEGIKRFIIGFSKKVFIANTMGNMADTVFAMDGAVNTLYAWLGAICYSMQIYYDFSAYSDMAIGIGRMFGFHFIENFDLPYRSKDIQEFWRRWHISLSSWFRDYVYIPLGGNRKGIFRTYFNLSVVFLLTGFWHGAAWQFVVWGIYHGFFSVLERIGLNKILKKTPKLFRHIYTMVIVVVGWVFFRADNLGKAFRFLRNMFLINLSGFKNYLIVEQFTSIFWICFFISIIFSVTQIDLSTRIKIWKNNTFVRIRYLLLWVISILYLIGLSYNPFIYFKF